jgi:hypothetical protein
MKWLLPFILLLTCLVSCTEKTNNPTMTASEVCQYVNQALPDVYTPQSSIIRFHFQYTAQSATFFYADNRWEVKVEVVKQAQKKVDNIWTDYMNAGWSATYTETYYFNESNGAVKAKQ